MRCSKTNFHPHAESLKHLFRTNTHLAKQTLNSVFLLNPSQVLFNPRSIFTFSRCLSQNQRQEKVESYVHLSEVWFDKEHLFPLWTRQPLHTDHSVTSVTGILLPSVPLKLSSGFSHSTCLQSKRQKLIARIKGPRKNPRASRFTFVSYHNTSSCS